MMSSKGRWLSLGSTMGVAALLVVSACGGGRPTATPVATATATRAAPTATATTAATATNAAPAPTATAASTPTAQATQSPQATTGAKQPAGTLSVAVAGLGPEVWNTRLTTGQEISFLGLIGDPLIALNPTTRALEGRWVSSWSLARDGAGATLTFKVRPGVVVNEGKGTITADDVRYNLQEFMKPDSRMVSTPKLLIDSDITNFESANPMEFKLRSKNFDASAIRSVAGSFSVWQPKAYSEAAGDAGYNAHPIGTGSFIFRSGERASKYTVEAVPNHWRKTSNIQTLNLLVVPEPATRVTMLKTGQADMGALDARLKPELGGNLRAYSVPGVSLVFATLGGMYYDVPDKNCTTCPWAGYNDKALKVRTAMDIAVNRKAIVDKLLSGEATPAAAPFVWWPGPYAHVDPNWQIPQFDAVKAKQLLAEAGYPNGFELEVPVFAPGVVPQLVDITEAVAGYWEAMGLKVKRVPMDYDPTFYQRMKDRTTGGAAWVTYVAVKDEALPDLRGTFSKFGNLAYLHDPKIDEYIAKASQEIDDVRRGQMGRELGTYVREQHLGISLFSINAVWGVNSRLVSWNNTAGSAYLNNAETIVIK